jgi:hypothetical protein
MEIRLVLIVFDVADMFYVTRFEVSSRLTHTGVYFVAFITYEFAYSILCVLVILFRVYRQMFLQGAVCTGFVLVFLHISVTVLIGFPKCVNLDQISFNFLSCFLLNFLTT